MRRTSVFLLKIVQKLRGAIKFFLTFVVMNFESTKAFFKCLLWLKFLILVNFNITVAFKINKIGTKFSKIEKFLDIFCSLMMGFFGVVKTLSNYYIYSALKAGSKKTRASCHYWTSSSCFSIKFFRFCIRS